MNKFDLLKSTAAVKAMFPELANERLEIYNLAKSLYCSNSLISLSHFLQNGNELKVYHKHGGQMVFIYEDNWRPVFYHKLIKLGSEYSVEHVEFKDKIKKICYDYPVFEISAPNKYVASNWSFFGYVKEFTKVKGGVHIEPDYEGATNNICEAISTFIQYHEEQTKKRQLEENVF